MLNTENLVYKPAEAFMVGPQEFTREFYKGTKSLMQQSVYGVAHTAGKLTGTVAGLANAAMRAVATDEDGEEGGGGVLLGDGARGGGTGGDHPAGGNGAFAVSKFGSDRIDGGDEGYSRMLRGAVSNVGRGLARPVQGVFDLDAKETAKSVVSLPVQVLGSLISGTLGFTARAFEGIADWSIGKRNLGMRRVARFFDIDGVLTPYNAREAQGHHLLLKLKLPRMTGELYVRHWSTGRELTTASGSGRKLVLLTTAQLYCFSASVQADGKGLPALRWSMPTTSCSVLPPTASFPMQAVVQSLPRDEFGAVEHRHVDAWGSGERNFFAFSDAKGAREFEAAVRWIASAPSLVEAPAAHCALRWALLAAEETRARRAARAAAEASLTACAARVQLLHDEGEQAMAARADAVGPLTPSGAGDARSAAAAAKAFNAARSARAILAHAAGGEIIRHEQLRVKQFLTGIERNTRTFVIEVQGYSWRHTTVDVGESGAWRRILWRWTVSRRYSDFLALRSVLERSALLPQRVLAMSPMPPKRFFGTSYSVESSDARCAAFRRIVAAVFETILAYPAKAQAMLADEAFCS